MIDTSTGEKLIVSDEGVAGPYIIVPVDQLDEVCVLLDQHRIAYAVDESAVSADGDPLLSVINLGTRVRADAIQAILDGGRP